MSTTTPWDAAELLPPKPEGPEFGFYAGGQAVAATREELVRETARGASLVWTPDSPRFVTAWEAPFLGEALRARTLFTLSQRIKGVLMMLVVLGALAAARFHTREFPVFAALAVFMGLLPLIEILRAQARLRRGILDAPETARFVRFQIWTRRRSQVAGWVLASCLAAAAVWQIVVGLGRSVELAAQFKPMVSEGEPWRLLTAGLIHFGLLHFGLNVLALIVLARLVEALGSLFHVFAVFTFSLVTGSLASQFLNPAPSLGSSGAVLGLLGFLVALAARRRGALPQGIRTWIVTMVLGVVLLGGAAPGLIDNAGHAGGFFGGLLLGWLLVPKAGEFPVRGGRLVRVLGALALAVVVLATLALPFTPRSDRLRQLSRIENQESRISHGRSDHSCLNPLV